MEITLLKALTNNMKMHLYSDNMNVNVNECF
jgi:hypothetical protein